MSEPLAVRVGRLLESTWTASAVAQVISRGVHQPMPEDDPAVPLLLKAGLLEHTLGGYALAGRDGLSGFESVALANIRSSRGQAFAIAEGNRGWAHQADEVLVAQGLASSAGGRGFAAFIESIPELKLAFDAGGVVLDVGVGVAALACAFCEAVPRSKVIGLDVLPRALELARQIVAEKGLNDRIDLRLLAVQDFEDEHVADLAHMSPIFIPRGVLVEGLRRIRRALKPGGWLALSGIVIEGLEDAATRFMAYSAGGSALTASDVARLVAEADFAKPIAAPLPPGSPRVLLCKAR